MGIPRKATAQSVADEIRSLSPPDQLRLAADLLEARRSELALTIVRRVATELGAALALHELIKR